MWDFPWPATHVGFAENGSETAAKPPQNGGKTARLPLDLETQTLEDAYVADGPSRRTHVSKLIAIQSGSTGTYSSLI